jgi:hypothetical protein
MSEYTAADLVGFGPTVDDLYEVETEQQLREIYDRYRG